MTDEIGLRKDMDRAAKAKALVENDMLKQGFDTLREEYLKAWEATGARDTDARERLWQAVQVVGKVRTALYAVISDGEIALRELRDNGLI